MCRVKSSHDPPDLRSVDLSREIIEMRFERLVEVVDADRRHGHARKTSTERLSEAEDPLRIECIEGADETPVRAGNEADRSASCTSLETFVAVDRTPVVVSPLEPDGGGV